MVGFDTSDDAAVYRLNDELAMIQTVDFFPPIVDDPYTFGQIAAANSISDVYAMGGVPRLAMNLMCFPSCLSLDVIKEMLEGGYSKVKEAGAIIAGGHTIEDNEPKYGLCVTGFAHPKDILANSTAREGDLLVLTKPIGTGILSTAAMAELLEEEHYRTMVSIMSELNRAAQETMMPFHPHACTDITGFGFLGHVQEMAGGSKLTAELFSKDVPIISKALALARDGIIPAGAYRNMQFLEGKVRVGAQVPQEVADALFDPQTSGGLLIALPEARAVQLLRELEGKTLCAAVVGRMTAKSDMDVIVR